MAFWVFMAVVSLFIPIIMVIFGKSFLKAAPKEINGIYGYRTAMSMKNQDTWEFAHKHFGKVWFYAGLILLPLNIIPLLFVMGESKDLIGTVGIMVCLIDTAVMLLSIIPTEKALKKNFDSDGNRIK